MQDLLDSPWIYGLPLLLLLIILARVLFRQFNRRVSVKPDRRVMEWVRSLDYAEKKLKREGLVRRPGETVGSFLARIENSANSREAVNAVNALREYEKHRWC